jgi:ribosome-associated protein
MSNDIQVKNGITIPEHELEITTSRSGGPGGQHVNKAETRITIRWNVKATQALTEEQKERVLNNLGSRLTSEGDLIVSSGASRSQQQNKQAAMSQLAQLVRKALYVPKKRMKTKLSKAVKEKRLKEKKKRSETKKLRSKMSYNE